MIPALEHYLVVSGALFSLGLLGVIMRRNLLIIYMSLEMMLQAAKESGPAKRTMPERPTVARLGDRPLALWKSLESRELLQ